jgi:hypothetical protein
MSCSDQVGSMGMTMSRPVRLAAHDKLARRGKRTGETARMVPNPRGEFPGNRQSGGTFEKRAL